MHHHVVDAVEQPPVERADHIACLVRGVRIHIDQPTGLCDRVETALSAEKHTVLVVDAAVPPEYTIRVDFLDPSRCLSGMSIECDFGDLNLLSARGNISVQVAGDEKRFIRGD